MNVRPIPGYEKYAVSDDGNVYRVLPDGALRLKRQAICTRGYAQIQLPSKNKKRRNTTAICLSTIVCTAFHGPKPPGSIVLYIDGDKTNNRADNLRWVTYHERCMNRIVGGKTGQQQHDERAALVKQRAAIKVLAKQRRAAFTRNLNTILFKNGVTSYRLGRRIGISSPGVYRWRNGVFPSTANQERIAAALGVTVEELLDTHKAGDK